MQPPSVHCIDVPSGACIPSRWLPGRPPARAGASSVAEVIAQFRRLAARRLWTGGGVANPPRASRPLSHHVRLPNLCNEPSALRACASGHNLTPARPASA